MSQNTKLYQRIIYKNEEILIQTTETDDAVPCSKRTYILSRSYLNGKAIKHVSITKFNFNV